MVKCFFPNRPLTAKASSNVGRSTTQTMSGDCLTADLERVIEKEKTQRKKLPPMKILFLACQKYQQFLIMKNLK